MHGRRMGRAYRPLSFVACTLGEALRFVAEQTPCTRGQWREGAPQVQPSSAPRAHKPVVREAPAAAQSGPSDAERQWWNGA